MGPTQTHNYLFITFYLARALTLLVCLIMKAQLSLQGRFLDDFDFAFVPYEAVRPLDSLLDWSLMG